MTREEKFETIVKLLSQVMFYDDWKWETNNERVIAMLMKEFGYYPFKDESEMIQHTDVGEELFDKLLEQAEQSVQ